MCKGIRVWFKVWTIVGAQNMRRGRLKGSEVHSTYALALHFVLVNFIECLQCIKHFSKHSSVSFNQLLIYSFPESLLCFPAVPICTCDFNSVTVSSWSHVTTCDHSPKFFKCKGLLLSFTVITMSVISTFDWKSLTLVPHIIRWNLCNHPGKKILQEFFLQARVIHILSNVLSPWELYVTGTAAGCLPLDQVY